MSECDAQEPQVRRFLLGQLEEHERRRIEEHLIVNAEYEEQVRLIEEGLIEDYIDDVLAPDERKAFETYFLATPRQRRKVKLAAILNTYGNTISTASDHPQTPAAPLSRPWSISLGIRNRPGIFAIVVAASLLAFVLGVSYGVKLWRERTERVEATKRKVEIERELTQLNSSTVQAPALSLALLPLATRDATELPTLSMPFARDVIELRLIVIGTVSPTYSADISKVGTDEVYSIERLTAQATPTAEVVLIRIPSRLMSPGDYTISLNGIAGDGKRTKSGEYPFQIRS